MTLCAAIRELLGKATDAPWSVYNEHRTLQIDPPGKSGERPAVVFWTGFDGNDMPHKVNVANAELIALLRNNAELLLGMAEDAARFRFLIERDSIIQWHSELGFNAYGGSATEENRRKWTRDAIDAAMTSAKDRP